jgi:dethiobiotin synthetase
MTRTWFVTGTDTGVGKTVVTAGLLRAAGAAGRRAVGLKPVAAGASPDASGTPANDDALLLQATASVALPYAAVNPVLLAEPVAPHLAAAREGRRLTVDELATAVRAALGAARADVAFVEGAGGWLCPVNETETLADLAVALGAGVVLVVGLRLGCLNHALLTAAAIRAAGLPLAGWVANRIDPAMLLADENIATLAARLPAPCLGTVPFLGASPTPADVAARLAAGALWAPP